LSIAISLPVLKSLAMTEKPQLFGTDGVRGVAGEYPLDRTTVRNLGRALGLVLENTNPARPVPVVLGEDTRESSAGISQALATGLRASGVEVSYAGVITTPGVAFLSRHLGFAAGVMVSASHNPFQDNGIKVLSSSGTKLSEAIEIEIEKALKQMDRDDEGNQESALSPIPQLIEEYLDYLEGLVPPLVRKLPLRLVVDCANGASSSIIPNLLRRIGIEAKFLNAAPNGRNINLRCGSLHPEVMAEETKTSSADLGVALDGDSDRAIFATTEGRIADGDHVLYAIAPHFKEQGRLKGNGVVGTLMTNLGLELALQERGIALKRTPVGDKYVLQEMLNSGINVGGEPSGHIIFSDVSHSGDGIVTLLQVLNLVSEAGMPFGAMVQGLEQFPQIIRNVRVREKKPLESIPEIMSAIAGCKEEVGGRGRVVVRYSGTERLARVMVEAKDSVVVERHAANIAKAIDRILGVK
jgi:phosphoglucosamine mutase